MNKCEHDDWGDWTPWFFYGSGLDIRERFCKLDCTGSDYEQRSHVHDYQPGPSDPFSPVGTGLTLQVCTICHDVKS